MTKHNYGLWLGTTEEFPPFSLDDFDFPELQPYRKMFLASANGNWVVLPFSEEDHLSEFVLDVDDEEEYLSGLQDEDSPVNLQELADEFNENLRENWLLVLQKVLAGCEDHVAYQTRELARAQRNLDQMRERITTESVAQEARGAVTSPVQLVVVHSSDHLSTVGAAALASVVCQMVNSENDRWSSWVAAGSPRKVLEVSSGDGALDEFRKINELGDTVDEVTLMLNGAMATAFVPLRSHELPPLLAAATETTPKVFNSPRTVNLIGYSEHSLDANLSVPEFALDQFKALSTGELTLRVIELLDAWTASLPREERLAWEWNPVLKLTMSFG